MSQMYWKDMIHIPEAVHASDFVLKLSDGVKHVDQTVGSYVVTKGVSSAFDQALSLIGTSLESRSSKATYLHGSFGSGKSHFMAVLDLLLDPAHTAQVRESLDKLAPVIVKHQRWLDRQPKLLMIPYHFLTAKSVEACILGGYVAHMRAAHPEASIPAVYRSEALMRNAEELRQKLGDEAFFKALELDGAGGEESWFASSSWDLASYEAARDAAPDSETHQNLVSALVTQLFSSMSARVEASQAGGGFVGIDDGLSIISKHAHRHGYDGIVLFLDELVLWMSQRASNLSFIKGEVEKLAKLVEAQNADRPVPIMSFVARQRSLVDFVGETYTGQDRATFDFSMASLQGRFGEIKLEDRDLPLIVNERLLKPRTVEYEELIRQSFERYSRGVERRYQEMMRTRDGDQSAFAMTYPFSPALVQALVALSSFLQRERTSLRLLLLLLVQQRDTLVLGSVVPVGDLWDVVAHDQTPFSDALRRTYQTARDLWSRKLEPMLLREYGLTAHGSVEELTEQKQNSFRNDARLLKTLLIAALVPEVEAMREMTLSKLTALNLSAITTLIPGEEINQVEQKLQRWATDVGEIRISDDRHDPRVTLQLSTLDVDVLLDRAMAQDNVGARRRKVRELLFDWLKLEPTPNPYTTTQVVWRGARRVVHVHYRNVRETSVDDLMVRREADVALYLDYPFDDDGYTSREDELHITDTFLKDVPGGTHAVAWLPKFLNDEGLQRLGKLVLVDYVLSHFDDFAQSYAVDQRPLLRPQLENLRHALRTQLRAALSYAYKLTETRAEMVVEGGPVVPPLVSLRPGVTPTSLCGKDFGTAVESLARDMLAARYTELSEALPDEHLTMAQGRKMFEEIERAIELSGTTSHEVEEKKVRELLHAYAVPLGLGKMGEIRFQFDISAWRHTFERALRPSEGDERELKVGHLYEVMSPSGEPSGLSSEMQELIACAYISAEQLVVQAPLKGVELPVVPGKLEASALLVRRKLPELEVWQRVMERMRDMFALREEFPLLTHKAAEQLRQTLGALARKERDAARAHHKLLLDHARTMLGPEHSVVTCKRIHAAEQLEALLTHLGATDHAELDAYYGRLDALTRDSLLSAAMTAQWNARHDVSQATVFWQAFELAVEKGPGGITAAERGLLAEARNVFTSHEHVLKFTSLDYLSQRLFKLLTQPQPAAPGAAVASPGVASAPVTPVAQGSTVHHVVEDSPARPAEAQARSQPQQPTSPTPSEAPLLHLELLAGEANPTALLAALEAALKGVDPTQRLALWLLPATDK